MSTTGKTNFNDHTEVFFPQITELVFLSKKFVSKNIREEPNIRGKIPSNPGTPTLTHAKLIKQLNLY